MALRAYICACLAVILLLYMAFENEKYVHLNKDIVDRNTQAEEFPVTLDSGKSNER